MIMKKLLGGLAIASLLVMGVGVSVAVNANSPVETKAIGELTNKYLQTSNNDWLSGLNADGIKSKYGTKYQFVYAGEASSGGWLYTLTVDLSEGEQFLVSDWEHGVACKYYNADLIKQGIVGDNNGTGNIYCRLTGNYTLTYRYTNGSDYCLEKAVLNDANEVYFVEDNASWKESGKMFMHAWHHEDGKDDVNYTNWNYSCPIEKTSILVGSGKYNFYKAKVPTACNYFKLKAYDGNTDYQTSNFSNVDAAVYTAYATTGYWEAGGVISKIYRALGDYEHWNGNTYSSSICAIDSSERASIATAYAGLDANGLSVFNASTMTTFDPENLSSTVNVTFQDIYAQLVRNTANGLPTKVSTAIGGDNSTMIAIVASAVTVSAVASAGLFLLRRRKMN